jgi:hypothetical protein
VEDGSNFFYGSGYHVRESEGLKRALDLVPPACYI